MQKSSSLLQKIENIFFWQHTDSFKFLGYLVRWKCDSSHLVYYTCDSHILYLKTININLGRTESTELKIGVREFSLFKKINENLLSFFPIYTCIFVNPTLSALWHYLLTDFFHLYMKSKKRKKMIQMNLFTKQK